ncbi:hypothetical protein F7725_012013, partial [Dissostichus mawsoni]
MCLGFVLPLMGHLTAILSRPILTLRLKMRLLMYQPTQKCFPLSYLVCATEPSPAQEIGKDGTVWTVMEPCGGTGRRQIQNILTESAGPTLHARGNITDKLTAFMCLCDCKPRRNVTILSTQHQHVAISTERKKKPETVEYYNHSKVGVDVLDQMARQYSVKGGTRRWPVAVFYNVLALMCAAINAWVLYRSCMSQNIPRRDFMLQLAHELRAEWMASKAPPLADLPFSGAEQSGKGRISCMVKTHCKQNKMSCKCIKCGDAVCGKCTAKVFNVCY